jgi:hypothetical protein
LLRLSQTRDSPKKSRTEQTATLRGRLEASRKEAQMTRGGSPPQLFEPCGSLTVCRTGIPSNGRTGQVGHDDLKKWQNATNTPSSSQLCHAAFAILIATFQVEHPAQSAEVGLPVGRCPVNKQPAIGPDVQSHRDRGRRTVHPSSGQRLGKNTQGAPPRFSSFFAQTIIDVNA